MFEQVPVVEALTGGILIGMAATLLLLFNGRIAGISGILNGLLDGRPDRLWRMIFLIGLLAGAAIHIYTSIRPGPAPTASLNLIPMLGGGFLVGFGTRLGGGCTSGHGVCGLGRLSPRSLVATLLYVAFGFVTVFIIRHLLGGGP
jgi:uncharacterized membrane protein YedE/YeeE